MLEEKPATFAGRFFIGLKRLVLLTLTYRDDIIEHTSKNSQRQVEHGKFSRQNHW
jgi:hypothetical protein